MDNTQHDTLYTNIRRNTSHPAKCSEKSYLCREAQEASLRRTGENVASRAKRALFCVFENFRHLENSPLLVRGNAPKTPFERAASSRTSYPSPSRKRQGSSTPSLVLSPKSHGFSGSPVCAAAHFCETLRSVTVIAGHAPFSPRARFCPAYDPRSACGAAARASHRANAGIWHTLPFSPIAAWRIPPASS